MNDAQRNEQLAQILRRELVPALGCTEPAAIGYAAALASAHLALEPERIELSISGDMLKNAHAVEIPRAEGMRGVAAAAALGACGADASLELRVFELVDGAVRARAKAMIESRRVRVQLARERAGVYICASVYAEGREACAEIAGSHTGVRRIVVDGREIVQGTRAARSGQAGSEPLTLSGIWAFATEAPLELLREPCARQVELNYALAEEGLRRPYGSAVGHALLACSQGLFDRMRAYAAAASDVRMAGCAAPVVINAGSGNQGLTISVPIGVYARAMSIPEEDMLRALALANLISIHIKSGIGNLSCFCGAVSAACACACGIGCLMGGGLPVVEQAIVNTLANMSGMICDGAKASCAAKIASALDAAFLGLTLANRRQNFRPGSGIVGDSAEQVIQAVWRIGSKGMRRTNQEVLKILMNNGAVHGIGADPASR